MSEQYVNLGSSTCTGSLDNSTNPTTVVVASGAGASFPSTTNGPFRIVVCDSAGTNAEVMLVTTRATDTFSGVYRGFLIGSHAAGEVPTPTLSTHSAGSIVVQAITAGGQNQIRADLSRTRFSGALPTDIRPGDILWPTDDVVLSVADTTPTLQPAALIQPLRGNPNAQTWSWLNQTGASVTTRSQSIVLVGTPNTGNNVQARVMTAPSTPYAIVATIIPLLSYHTFCFTGVLFTDGTLISAIGPNQAGTNLVDLSVSQYNNPTSFNNQPSLLWNSWLANGYPMTLVLQDDGTTKKYGYSADGGLHIKTVYSESHTNFVTPSKIGFFYDAATNNTYDSSVIVTNWYISTSTLF